MQDVNTKKSFENVLIAGYGDIGRRVARLLDLQNTVVTGLARSPASVEQMKLDHVIPFVADLDRRESLQAVPTSQVLLFYFAPPPTAGVSDTRMANFLSALSPHKLPSKIIYISTTGVYGDQAGNPVSEDTAPCPGADRSRRRLNAEQQLKQFVKSQTTQIVELVILRVSGIYGPGRLPEKRIRNRIPVLNEALAPNTNRIHADDLANICIAAAERGRDNEIYNVSDGCNSNMTDYFFKIADYLGLQRPPTVNWGQAEQQLSTGMLSYLRESRKINNQKMMNHLQITLKYPDLSSGLAAMK